MRKFPMSYSIRNVFEWKVISRARFHSKMLNHGSQKQKWWVSTWSNMCESYEPEVNFYELYLFLVLASCGINKRLMSETGRFLHTNILTLEKETIAKFIGPTWGPPGSCRPQMGPMLAPMNLTIRERSRCARRTNTNMPYKLHSRLIRSRVSFRIKHCYDVRRTVFQCFFWMNIAYIRVTDSITLRQGAILLKLNNLNCCTKK